MRLRIVIPATLALTLFTSLLGPSAMAQEAGVDRTAAARALFDAAIEAADEGRWEDAAEGFQRALSLRASPQIAYNLAGALVELGRFVRATELLRQVGRDPTVDADVRQAAEARRAEILPRVARLTIRVETAGTSVVMLDERQVDSAALEVPLPVDPGAHVLELRQGSRAIARRRIELGEGEAREVVLSERDAESGETDAIEARVEGSLDGAGVGAGGSTSEDPVGTWWFWTSIVGAVLLVGGAVTIGVVLGTQDSVATPIDGNGIPPVIFIGVGG